LSVGDATTCKTGNDIKTVAVERTLKAKEDFIYIPFFWIVSLFQKYICDDGQVDM
jgi:hypothetical protein